MEATSFDGENVVLDKPDGMSYDDCNVMSACKMITDGGFPVIVTCWKVTAKELEEIKRTGRVWCYVLGCQTPPVHLTGISPFED